MKINISKEIRNSNSLAGHIVLHGLTEAMSQRQFRNWADRKHKAGKDIYSDIQLTIDGIPIPFMSFVSEWDRQTDDLMKEAAKNIIADHFSYISDLLYDLEERIKPEIEKRLEEWEVKSPYEATE